MKRVKVINGYTALSNWINFEAKQTGKTIARTNLPSPYSYSPTHIVYSYKNQDVILVETRHRRYEVYAI